MKKYLVILGIVSAISFVSIYIWSMWQIPYFNYIGSLTLFSVIGMLIVMLHLKVNRMGLFIGVVVLLNVYLSYITIVRQIVWEQIYSELFLISIGLLIYSTVFLGYKRYSNIIYMTAITLSYSLYSSVASTYHWPNGVISNGLYDDVDAMLVMYNGFIGFLSIGLLLGLSRMQNRHISRYLQIIIQVIAITIMFFVLGELFLDESV
jgi:hypothetical protein